MTTEQPYFPGRDFARGHGWGVPPLIRTQFSDGAYPHLVLRIGLVTQVAASVRPDPGDILFPAGDDHAQADRG